MSSGSDQSADGLLERDLFSSTVASGLFRAYYYPEGGGSYYQASTSTTSFTRTGKLWWDPWQGGDGAIYSSIDGVTMGPLAEVDNCSRVIRYVITLGYRYSSATLMDMRIHDVNVVADLNSHDPDAEDPDEPVVEDGTLDGNVEPSQDAVADDMGVTAAEQIIVVYWTGWWPLLRVDILDPIDSTRDDDVGLAFREASRRIEARPPSD